MPSAYHELAQVYRIWSPDALDPLPEALRDSAPVLKGHPILGLSTFGQDQPVSPALGYEEIFCADLDVRSEALVRPQTARMNLKTLLIPPSTIESALQAQIESLKRIGVLRDWAGRGVSASLTRLTNSTSYPPFWIPSDHPYIEAVNQAVMRVSGEPAILEAGTSNADENKYVIEGEKPGLSVPMKGGGPHSPLEWLSASDMARNYLMFRELFSRCLPDLVAAKHKL
jgi:acetylornithine deacetylase/succinyl-diaminopimelate desuccinylase-like protein